MDDETLLSEDHSEIVLVNDAVRSIWEPKTKPVSRKAAMEALRRYRERRQAQEADGVGAEP